MFVIYFIITQKWKMKLAAVLLQMAPEAIFLG